MGFGTSKWSVLQISQFPDTNTILVSILEWINCGTDTAETSPDNSMDNSTEEEDQV